MKPKLCKFYLAVLVALGSVQISTAQDTEELQYEDAFDEFGPEWGEPGPICFVQDGVMVMKVDPGWTAWPLNKGMIFEDADMSVRTRQVSGKNLNHAAGLLFWTESVEKFYLFGITREGSLVVIRRVGDKWMTPVTWRVSDAIKKGLDEWNELRVQTKGKQATLYVNGSEIVTMKGQPPAGGSFIGFYGNAPADESVTYEFDDLRVK